MIFSKKSKPEQPDEQKIGDGPYKVDPATGRLIGEWRRRRGYGELNARGRLIGYTDIPFEILSYSDPSANLVTSQIEGTEFHAPIFDFDFPCELVPSATAGHYHLYLDKPLTFDDYCKVLDVFCEVGLLEEGWVKSAKAQKFAVLRAPGILKYEVERAQSSIRALVRDIEESLKKSS